MSFVTLLFVILSVLCVFVIAAVTIGREARRLDAVAPRAVYQIDLAVDWVADQLPEDTQARLTEDELRALLVAHMNWMHARGLLPEKVTDRPQDIDSPVIVDETTVAAYLLGEAERLGVTILDDVDIVRVVDSHLLFFDAIGAVGPETTPDQM
jgi:hypothetical protein